MDANEPCPSPLDLSPRLSTFSAPELGDAKRLVHATNVRDLWTTEIPPPSETSCYAIAVRASAFFDADKPHVSMKGSVSKEPGAVLLY